VVLKITQLNKVAYNKLYKQIVRRQLARTLSICLKVLKFGIPVKSSRFSICFYEESADCALLSCFYNDSNLHISLFKYVLSTIEVSKESISNF